MVEVSKSVRVLMCTCLLLLVIPAMATQAATIHVSDEIQVQRWPDPLVLGYGETKEFIVTVQNTGDRTLGIYIEWVSCECIYGHSGSVSESYIELGPGSTRDVTVSVTSGSRLFGDNCGEGMLRFEWGPNITLVDGRPDDQTVEGHGNLDANVQDDPNSSYLVITAVIAIVVVAVAGLVVLVRTRRKAKGQPR